MRRILILALMGLIASAGNVFADDIIVNNGSFKTNFGGSFYGGYAVPVYQPVVVQRTCCVVRPPCVRVVQPVVTCVRIEPVQTVVVVRPVCVTKTVVVTQAVVIDDSTDVVEIKEWASCGKYFTDKSGNRWKIFRGDPVVGVNRLTTLRGEEWRGSDGTKQFFTFTYNRQTWTFTPG